MIDHAIRAIASPESVEREAGEAVCYDCQLDGYKRCPKPHNCCRPAPSVSAEPELRTDPDFARRVAEGEGIPVGAMEGPPDDMTPEQQQAHGWRWHSKAIHDFAKDWVAQRAEATRLRLALRDAQQATVSCNAVPSSLACEEGDPVTPATSPPVCWSCYSEAKGRCQVAEELLDAERATLTSALAAPPVVAPPAGPETGWLTIPEGGIDAALRTGDLGYAVDLWKDEAHALRAALTASESRCAKALTLAGEAIEALRPHKGGPNVRESLSARLAAIREEGSATEIRLAALLSRGGETDAK